jgi:hypothetical protein
MMEADAPHVPERVAGKFPSVEQDIVSTRANRIESQRLNGVENDPEAFAEIEFRARENDRKVQIPEIVILPLSRRVLPLRVRSISGAEDAPPFSSFFTSIMLLPPSRRTASVSAGRIVID